eukprot:3299969-Pleurochrysis_carterae.AAC.1
MVQRPVPVEASCAVSLHLRLLLASAAHVRAGSETRLGPHIALPLPSMRTPCRPRATLERAASRRRPRCSLTAESRCESREPSTSALKKAARPLSACDARVLGDHTTTGVRAPFAFNTHNEQHLQLPSSIPSPLSVTSILHPSGNLFGYLGARPDAGGQEATETARSALAHKSAEAARLNRTVFKHT